MMLKRKRRQDAIKKYREKKKINLENHKKTVNYICVTETNLDQNFSLASSLSTSISSLSFINKTKTSSSSSSSSSTDHSLLNITSSSCDTNESDEEDSYDDNLEVSTEKLYADSTINYESFMESLSSLMFRHNLNDETVKDLLSLTKSILPHPNICPRSANKIYDSILKERNNYINRYFFCKNCQLSIETEICKSCKTESISYIILDVIYQIQSILSRSKIIEKLFQVKNNKTTSTLNSCLDGSIYQDYLKNNKYDLTVSLCLNTDGAPMITSKSLSLWPFIAKIIELPDSISESFENLIFIGLWLDNEKPNYEVFMTKCVDAILSAINSPNLKSLGNYLILNIINRVLNLVFKGNLSLNIRCHNFVADLPARAAFLNVKQFNGYYGCLNCFHPGEYSDIYNKVIFKPHDDVSVLVILNS
jgi:hypothetical protein